MKRILFLILALPFFQSANSQTVNPMSFFPHHDGDVWQYWESSGDSSKNFITQDSLGSDGRYYVQTTLFYDLVIDTTTMRVYQRWKTDELLFQLDADSGVSWTVYQDTIGRTSAQVSREFLGYIFNSTPVLIKQIDFYGRRLTDKDSLLTDTYYLASGIGMIQEDFDAMTVRIIKGAKIDGIIYGSFTSVKENPFLQLPKDAQLEQNYPNPFNPSTMIEYDLAGSNHVTLKIYNVLGQMVATLVDGIQHAGHKSVSFKAGNLSNGVYFYRLQAGSFIDVKKMLLAK